MMDYAKLGEKLHEESIVIDALSFLYTGPSSKLNPKRVTATNATVPETYHEFAETVMEVARTRKMIAEDPNAVLIQNAGDIERAKKDGRVGIIMGFQATLPLGTDLDRVQLFNDLGVKVIQLTYNWRTFSGDGCLEDPDGGLPEFGRQLVRELGRVGVLLDLSHGGRRTTLEAIEAAEVPPVFTHANPLALTKSQRNLTDEQMKAVAAAGGVIGICCWGPICWKNKPEQPTVDDYLDHIDYAVELVGIDHVGISTDSPCTDRMDLITKHSLEFSAAFPGVAGEYNRLLGIEQAVRYPKGLPGIGDLRPVTGGLLKRGYRPEDVQKVIGLNFMRVFKQVWK